jgi:hypothetical protein
MHEANHLGIARNNYSAACFISSKYDLSNVDLFIAGVWRDVVQEVGTPLIQHHFVMLLFIRHGPNSSYGPVMSDFNK